MYSFFKRGADFIFAFLGIILLLPLFIVLMVVLKFSGEGEVFYLQERLGYLNKRFGIIKFATMLKNSMMIGSKTITVRNDPRITKPGKFLRFFKLNELPQIINVLKGDMSFVGPRPMLETSYMKYSVEVREIIYKTRPGITGLGSLIFRDEEKLVSAFKAKGGDPMDFYKSYIYPYKGQLEAWYFQRVSFIVDLKILILTFWSILRSNHSLTYKWFPDLPEKPKELTLEGIQQLVVKG